MKPKITIRDLLVIIVLVAMVVVIVVQERRIDDLDARTRKINRANVDDINKFIKATNGVNKYYLSLKKRVDQLEKGGVAAPRETGDAATPRAKPAD
jgi:hypothetical protein